MACFASRESVPGFAAAPSGQSLPITTTESPRTRASGATARRTRRRAMRQPVGLWVIAGGQDRPAPVATHEVDRKRIRQLFVDTAYPHGHASAARVDALEPSPNDLGLATPGSCRDAEPLERGARLLVVLGTCSASTRPA